MKYELWKQHDDENNGDWKLHNTYDTYEEANEASEQLYDYWKQMSEGKSKYLDTRFHISMRLESEE